MKTLDIDIVDDESKKIIAKVQIMQISELTPSNPIKGYFIRIFKDYHLKLLLFRYFPAFDFNQKKIADIYISIQFESVHKSIFEFCLKK